MTQTFPKLYKNFIFPRAGRSGQNQSPMLAPLTRRHQVIHREKKQW